MIRKKCNANNAEGAKFCVSCGATMEEPQVVVQNTQNVGNSNNTSEIPVYKPASAIVAIVVAFLCCGGIIGAIFAILSLVEGSKVKTFVQQGDIVAANMSLAQAKKWNKIAWIIIAVFSVLMILYLVFVFGMAILSEM